MPIPRGCKCNCMQIFLPTTKYLGYVNNFNTFYLVQTHARTDKISHHCSCLKLPIKAFGLRNSRTKFNGNHQIGLVYNNKIYAIEHLNIKKVPPNRSTHNLTQFILPNFCNKKKEISDTNSQSGKCLLSTATRRASRDHFQHIESHCLWQWPVKQEHYLARFQRTFSANLITFHVVAQTSETYCGILEFVISSIYTSWFLFFLRIFASFAQFLQLKLIIR